MNGDRARIVFGLKISHWFLHKAIKKITNKYHKVIKVTASPSSRHTNVRAAGVASTWFYFPLQCQRIGGKYSLSQQH
jgi:hypothetical protein